MSIKLYPLLQGLCLVLTDSESSLREMEEREQMMEEESSDGEPLHRYQWLLRDLPNLPLFSSVCKMTSLALQQVSFTNNVDGVAGC